MTVADLHVHTTNSDGTLTIETIPEAARSADLDAVAVTDHDRLHPELDSPVVTIEGLTVVHGIELRVDTGDQRIDLLGYGLEQTPALVSLVDRLQQDRIDRARAIVGSVESRLGVDLDVTFQPGVGRPHIARAIADSDVHLDYEGAFDELIGDGCPCYVSREIPSFERGAQVLGEACALVGLAHPFRYDDPAGALDRAASLDAIEVHYPYGREVDTSPAARLAAAEDLVVTGGSDAHDETLGLAGLEPEEFERFGSHLDI